MLILIIFFFLIFQSTTTTATQNRRILHQPFFPSDSPPPTPPPLPSPPPPIPFSNPTPTTNSNNNNNSPFFPTFPTPPPPPSPASLASFPANISSITVPNSSKSKSTSKKLIAIAVTVVIAAIAALSLAVCFHHRRKSSASPPLPPKSNRSTNSPNSTAHPPPPPIPKLQRPSQTSSEFLYLGTLVSSHPTNTNIAATYPNSGHNSSSLPRKLDSPELRPLPPLSGQQLHNFRSGEVDSSRDDDSFYSPKGSSIGNGSASRRGFTFAAVPQPDNLRRSSSNSSSTYSSSVSGSGSVSPARSVSLSLSPANTASPIYHSTIPKSPDLIEIQTIRPLHQQMPSPPRVQVTDESPSASSQSSSAMSSPRFSNEESPMRIVQQKASSVQMSSPRFSNEESPVRIPSPIELKPSFVQMPPPPPPPPPPSLPLRPVHDTHPPPPPPPPRPVVITPLKPTAVENVASISVDSFHSAAKDVELESIKNEEQNEETAPKLKLKPLHWDKVRASSDREMVWDQLKCSSFKLNEEMIETLFVVNTPKPSPKEVPKWQVLPSPGADNGNRVLDQKKAQNISILLRALSVTVEEVCEGLLEGNVDALGTELLESLLKMAPSKEEERKLKDYKDDSPVKLGAAEKFLKAVLDIPDAFKRVESMLYVSNFDSEVEYLKKSFETLELACEELRTSRMFLKLLEAVLKTGNRMNVGTNRGDAHAFKLDTLLKLVDVKGADGKTTLLHFVVQEITRTEGARLSSGENPTAIDDAKCRKLGLQVVSDLSSELSNVKKAAVMDAEVLSSDVMKLSKGIMSIGEVARLNQPNSSPVTGSSSFSESMKCFMRKAEEDIIRIQAQESVALSLVKEITEYFHGNSAKEEAHPFRIFMVVRDFLTVLDRVCKEVGMINERTIVSSAHKFPVPINPMLQPVLGGLQIRRQNNSGEEDPSP